MSIGVSVVRAKQGSAPTFVVHRQDIARKSPTAYSFGTLAVIENKILQFADPENE